MTLTDIIILMLVGVFIVSLIYFRWIKKSKEDRLSCHCYKRTTCETKVIDLKDLLKKDNYSNDSL